MISLADLLRARALNLESERRPERVMSVRVAFPPSHSADRRGKRARDDVAVALPGNYCASFAAFRRKGDSPHYTRILRIIRNFSA